MATFRMSIGPLLVPDTSGNVWWQPSSILDTNDKFPTVPVLIFKDTSTKDTAMCGFQIPKNYVSTPKFYVRFKTTATSGNALWTIDYTTIATGATGDPSAYTESLAGTATAVPGTTNFEAEHSLTATAGNFAVDNHCLITVGRNGAGADTVAASLQLIDLIFEWADA